MSVQSIVIDRLARATREHTDRATGGLARFFLNEAKPVVEGDILPRTYESILSAMSRAAVAAAVGVGETFDRGAAEGLDAAPLAQAIDLSASSVANPTPVQTALARSEMTPEGPAVAFKTGELVEAVGTSARSAARNGVHDFIRQVRSQREALSGVEKHFHEGASVAVEGKSPPIRGFVGIGRKLMVMGAIGAMALNVSPAQAGNNQWKGFVAGMATGVVLQQAVPQIIPRIIPQQNYATPVYQPTYQPAYQPAYQPVQPMYGQQPSYGQQAVMPSRRIVEIAKAVEASTTGQWRASSDKVDNVIALGAQCASRTNMQYCVSNFDGIHMDFARGIYGVQVRGITMAMERNGAAAIPQPAMVEEALRQARAIRSQEMAQNNGYYAPPPRY